MKTEEHTNVNVKNMVEEIELKQEESVAAKRLKKVEQQFNGQCLGQEDATYNDEQISSDSITGESSGGTVDEQYRCVSVKNMIEKIESLEKESVVAKGLKKVEQQFNGQPLEQYDATYNNEQTSSSPITNENNTDKVNDMLEKRKAIEDREAKARQLQKAEQRLANNQKRVEQEYLHNQYPEQYTTHNDEQTSLDLTTNGSGSSSSDSGINTSTEDINKELAKYLEEHGGDVDAQDGNGCTLLHFAVAENKKELVELLIAHRANVDAQDRDKRTSLHLAAVMSDIGIIKYLVKNGADFNVQDKHGILLYVMPLHIEIVMIQR